MIIWVDADACPVAVREILFRAATRTQTEVILVANRKIETPRSAWIRFMQVPAGFDAADDEIIRHLQAGDLVVTGDIPLAAEVLERKGMALTPRGEMFSENSIRAQLTMRDFMETMRHSGVQTGGGPSAFSRADSKSFADKLDTLLRRAVAAKG